MSCTVACFCGNTYVAPPERCGVCGRTLPDTARRRALAHRTAPVADSHSLIPEADLRDHETHGVVVAPR